MIEVNSVTWKDFERLIRNRFQVAVGLNKLQVMMGIKDSIFIETVKLNVI